MKITLIKHGKTDFNLEGRRQGRRDLSLNDVGKKEVFALKNKIRQDFNIILSSPLMRTLETAKILFPGKKVLPNDLLIEYDFGELEGVKFSTPLEKFPNNKVEEYNGIKFLMPNRGESFEDLVERCKKFIKYLKENFKKNDVIAVVTHSTNLEIIKALAEGDPWHKYLAQAKNFHGFVEIEI